MPFGRQPERIQSTEYRIQITIVLFLIIRIQLLEVEEQDDDDGDGDTTVREIEDRTEEQHFSGTIADKREIEHVDHATVEPTGITEQLAVEDAVDDVA